MKILDSKIFDAVNLFLAKLQTKTDKIRQNSYLLLNIDFFIILSICLTFLVSIFADTTLIGIVSVLVPVLVVIKTLITEGEKIELEKCNFFLIIYLLICLISNFTSSMPAQSFYGFMKTLIYFAFYFALCQFLKNNKKYIIILLLVLAALISFESAIGIIQNSFGVENISTWQDISYVNPEDILSRVYGTLKPYNPNLFGGYLISGIASLVALAGIYFNKNQYKLSLLALILFLMSSFTIFLTGCRGAYLALFIIFLGIIIASYNKKYEKSWKLFVIICIICSIVFLLFNHGILHRLMSIFILRGDSSTSFRMNVYNSAIQMFKDNWLFGIGVGNKVFREIYGLYMLSGFDALSCYSIFLEMAVESGIFALLAYIFYIIALVDSFVRKFIVSDVNYKILLFASMISILAVMFHGIFDTVYFRPQIQFVFWTMASILTVLVREKKAE